MSIRLILLPWLLAAGLLLSACRPDPEQIVIYSGRTPALVDGLVEDFRAGTAERVQVRYGRDAELLAALEEEGRRSPAALFWANTVGALSAALNAGLLVPLPDSLLALPAAFVPSGGHWIPLSVRFRAVAYHPERVAPEALPASVMDLPRMEALRGRIGWTPTYSSFQDFITAMRVLYGEDAARRWLEDMLALAPQAYVFNAAMLEAIAAGEIDLALTNHYYILRVQHDAGPARIVQMHHFAPGDLGNLALVTGAGVLATARAEAPAVRFLAHLLGPEAQSRVATEIFEYPVIYGTPLPPGSAPFEEVLRLSPELDHERLRDLPGTLRLLRDVGLL